MARPRKAARRSQAPPNGTLIVSFLNISAFKVVEQLAVDQTKPDPPTPFGVLDQLCVITGLLFASVVTCPRCGILYAYH